MSDSPDPFDLLRFVRAQDRTFDDAWSELTAGRKRTHWIWFVFPQMRGLGMSSMSQRYGIVSLAEARAYLAHPVLGERLHRCVGAMVAHADLPASAVLGELDAMKFRSCLTLFREAAGPGSIFDDGLAAFFGGQPDGETLELLARTRVRK